MAKPTVVTGDDLIPSRSRARTANPAGTRQHGAVPSDSLIPMQFRMKPDFAREFRMEATRLEMKYNELLKAMFVFWREAKK